MGQFYSSQTEILFKEEPYQSNFLDNLKYSQKKIQELKKNLIDPTYQFKLFKKNPSQLELGLKFS